MSRTRICAISIIFLLLLLSFFSFFIKISSVDDNIEGKNGPKEQGFIRSSSALAVTYWDRAKTHINRVRAHFFPPNLDFRGSEEDIEKKMKEGSAGEKVKEAVTESIKKTKATVEDTAKSAAQVASETMHKTKEKLKKSLSDKGGEEESNRNEL